MTQQDSNSNVQIPWAALLAMVFFKTGTKKLEILPSDWADIAKVKERTVHPHAGKDCVVTLEMVSDAEFLRRVNPSQEESQENES